MRETQFKITEIGTIPQDWKIISLGEIGEPRMCRRILKEQTQISGEIPFYKIGTFGYDADAYIPRTLFEEYKNKYYYPNKGDVLISAAGTIGRLVVFSGQEAYYQDSNIVWIENDENIVINSFLYHSLYGTSWDTSQGTISRLYNHSLKAKKISVPSSLDEQCKIAKALSDIDGLIDSLSKLIEKKKNIKTGTMQQLLTGKKRLAGFSEAWEKRKLGEVFDFMKGAGLSKEKLISTGKYKCMLYGEIFTRFNYMTNAEFNKTNSTEGVLSHVGDILMPGSTTTNGNDLVKAVMITEDDVQLGGDIIILRKKENNIDSYFWASLISHIDKSKIAEMTQGTTIIHLHSKNLSEITYLIPPSKEEQIAIAEILMSMDTEISSLEAKKEKYELIKKGMMQELLTGRVRLV